MHRASQFRPWSCGTRKTTARSARRPARRRCSGSSRQPAKRAARSSMVIRWPPIRAAPFPSTAMPALKKRWSRKLPSSFEAKKRIDGTSDYRDGRCNRCLVEISRSSSRKRQQPQRQRPRKARQLSFLSTSCKNVAQTFLSRIGAPQIDIAWQADACFRVGLAIIKRHAFLIVWRRSEEHTSELQSPDHLVCRLLLEK